MAAYVGPGIWQCNFCLRVLPEAAFRVDGWRRRRNKGPGRCDECEKELTRSKTAFSRTARFATADHTAAYRAAKETCRARLWGMVDYVRWWVPVGETRQQLRVRLEREAEGRLGCCGAPALGPPEGSSRFYTRHRTAGSVPCERAVVCRNLYMRRWRIRREARRAV